MTWWYITVHTRPRSVWGTSSARWWIVLRCGSAHSKCSVCVPSAVSVSGTGTHPNGAHAAAEKGCASTVNFGASPIKITFLYAERLRV